jgi:hypothetical protein
MLQEFVAAQGFSDRLAAVVPVSPTGADIARDPDGSLALLADAAAVQRHGANVVLPGGAVLAGLAGPLSARLPVQCSIRSHAQFAWRNPWQANRPAPRRRVALSLPLRKLLQRP